MLKIGKWQENCFRILDFHTKKNEPHYVRIFIWIPTKVGATPPGVHPPSEGTSSTNKRKALPLYLYYDKHAFVVSLQYEQISRSAGATHS